MPMLVRTTTASGGYHREHGWLMAFFIADGARTSSATRGFLVSIDTEANDPI